MTCGDLLGSVNSVGSRLKVQGDGILMFSLGLKSSIEFGYNLIPACSGV